MINWATSDGTAVAGADFESRINQTLEITNGTSGMIQIRVKQDEIYEKVETFTVTLSDPEHAIIPGSTEIIEIIVSIEDDEEPPMVKFTNITAVEFEDVVGGMIELEISLSGIASEDILVTYSASVRIGLGHATADIDFVSPTSNSNISTISAGQRTGIIQIGILDDELDEQDEEFTIVISDPQNAVLSNKITDSMITVTITDDDVPELSILAGPSVTEGPNVKAIFKVISSIEPKAALAVQYTPEGAAFIVGSSTKMTAIPAISFTRNETTGKYEGKIEIDIVDDVKFEPDGFIKVTLNELARGTIPITYSVVSPASARVLVANDDPEVIISVSEKDLTPRIEEANTTLTIPLILSIVPTETVMIDWNTVEGTASTSDFIEQKNQTLEIIDEKRSRINIQIISDELNEGDEKFTIVLGNVRGGSFAGDSDTITIEVTIIDDEEPTLSLANSTFRFSENGSDIVINLNLSGATSSVVTYNYTLSGGTAIAGEDYTIPEELTGEIVAGLTTADIVVPVKNDKDNEGKETFNIFISNLEGAVFLNNRLTLEQEITIVDDENPKLSILVVDLEVDENTAEEKVDLVVNLSGPIDDPVVVSYEIETVVGGASAGLDFTENNQNSFTIVADEITGTVSIPILDDLEDEGNEQFKVKITNVTNAVLDIDDGESELVVTITIVDDEQPILSFAETNLSIVENAGAIEVQISLSKSFKLPVKFEYETVDVKATSGEFGDSEADFVGVDAGKSLIIGAGSTTEAILIPILDNDTEEEFNEEFRIKISNVINALLPDRLRKLETIVTIIDDLAPPEIAISVDSKSVNEGDPAVFILETFHESALPLVVDLNVEQEGEFLMWRAPRSLNMTQNKTILEIETQDDLDYEPNGKIKLL